MNAGDIKCMKRNGSGRLWCWLGISEWRAISDCGSLLFLLVTQSVIYSSWLTWRLQPCCKSGVHFLSDCHLCVDLVGLLRQLPSYSVQSCKSQRPLRAKFRRGGCSSRLEGYTRDNLTPSCGLSRLGGRQDRPTHPWEDQSSCSPKGHSPECHRKGQWRIWEYGVAVQWSVSFSKTKRKVGWKKRKGTKREHIRG